MKERILCYGDSNTYGYDASVYFGGRFPEAQTWVGRLNNDPDLADFQFINAGENGRTIPSDGWSLVDLQETVQRFAPLRLITVMLGSNDLLMLRRPRVSAVAGNMDTLLNYLLHLPAVSETPSRLLLIAPPRSNIRQMDPYLAAFDEAAAEFGSAYKQLAAHYGVHFADAGSWDLPLAQDGVHLTAQAHENFAAEMKKVLTGILFPASEEAAL